MAPRSRPPFRRHGAPHADARAGHHRREGHRLLRAGQGQAGSVADGGALAPIPLTTIQALSGLGLPEVPTVYKDGANYVFIAVGDPVQPTFSHSDGGGPGDGGDGTSYNTKSLHYLAFPTDPTVEPTSPDPVTR